MSATFEGNAVTLQMALMTNVVYLWNNQVHASDTRRALEMNAERDGMKRILEEEATRYVQVIHYSALAGIRVGGEKGTSS